MAAQNRPETPDLTAELKRALIRDARRFSFFQVLRLLERLGDAGVVRIRPELSFVFPASDVAEVRELVEQEDGEKGFEVLATFLGLYGASSPLPNFYTEELFEEALEDSSVKRDFLDILNQRLYELLYEIWHKYHLAVEVTERGSRAHLDRLFCLMGLGTKEAVDSVEDARLMLRYLGLLTQWPRSAAALETLLRDRLELRRLHVIPCIERRVRIPEEQRCRLGAQPCTLGQDAVIGSETRDMQGKFRIEVGPVDRETFFSLSPGGEKERLLRRQVNFYLNVPLECEIKLTMDGRQVHTTRPGAEHWSHLGMDTWIFSGSQLTRDITVTFNA